MTAFTHFSFSYLVTSAAGADHATSLAASLFSLAPDIDHPQSLIGRFFPGLSRWLLKKYGHRTVTHSLISIIVVAAALSPALLFSGRFYGAALLAYSSHIFIDLFNSSGVRLLAPFSTKEFISFKTPELRITVSSWKEYALLFVIVFLAFSVTGKSFSITKSVRSMARHIYKNYTVALKDFRDNSGYISKAQILYFDHGQRTMVQGTYTVLSMYKDKIFLLDGRRRFVVLKDEIEEIEVLKTEDKLSLRPVSGTNPALLREIPEGAYITGEITIHDYAPEIRSTDFIEVTYRTDVTKVALSYANPGELGSVILVDEVRKDKIKRLTGELTGVQIAKLEREQQALKAKLKRIRQSGFYDNYSQIIKLDNDIKKIQSRIDTLAVRAAQGADEKILSEIRSLESGGRMSYELWICEI
jgi:membrane-bound metal-dependent hydrolase YbcI (DUF457 family)